MHLMIVFARMCLHSVVCDSVSLPFERTLANATRGRATAPARPSRDELIETYKYERFCNSERGPNGQYRGNNFAST